MSGRPWYKRCGADFIEGTMGLSLEEKGAYSLCLDLIYSHGGPIADDPRWIAGICNVSVRRWNSIRLRLIEAGKIFIDDGCISNARANKELFISPKTPRESVENTPNTQDKSAENEAAPSQINDLAPQPSGHIDKSREDKKEEPLRGPLASSEVEVFSLGKTVLGKSAGGVITKLRKACEYDDAHAVEWLRKAAEKENPMEWMQAVLRATADSVYRGVIGAKVHEAPAIRAKADRSPADWHDDPLYRNVL
jgi:uncharacterized protein YdaU (DUF1376 family)